MTSRDDKSVGWRRLRESSRKESIAVALTGGAVTLAGAVASNSRLWDVPRPTHKPEVVGSNPAPATKFAVPHPVAG